MAVWRTEINSTVSTSIVQQYQPLLANVSIFGVCIRNTCTSNIRYAYQTISLYSINLISVFATSVLAKAILPTETGSHMSNSVPEETQMVILTLGSTAAENGDM